MTTAFASATLPQSGEARLDDRVASPASFLIVWIVVAVALLQIPSAIPDEVRLRAGLLWILLAIPTILYVGQRRSTRRPIPTLPLLGLVHALYYAFPPLAGIVNAAYRFETVARIPPIDPRIELAPAIELVTWGWLMLLSGYGLSALFLIDRPVRPRPLLVARLAPVLWLVATCGVALEALGALSRLPIVLGGTLDFVKLAGRFALTVLLALRTQRYLPARHGQYLLIVIVIEMILLATTGSMANPMIFGVTLSLGFWLARGRVGGRLVAGVAAAVLIAVGLKGIAAQYRQEAWWVREELTPIEEASIMSGLAHQQVESHGVAGAIALGAKASMERSATLDLLADVMRRTPKEIPYWNGHTYYSLVGAFVPRFLWPDKPAKNVGNQFGHRYAYLAYYDRWTAVNMPYLLEFYANFGFGGVVWGMFLTGVVIRILDTLVNRPGTTILRAAAAFVVIFPIFGGIESDFSLVFGGLVMNGVAMMLLVRYIERKAAAPPREGAIRTVPGAGVPIVSG